jgi:hypothetical protein
MLVRNLRYLAIGLKLGKSNRRPIIYNKCTLLGLHFISLLKFPDKIKLHLIAAPKVAVIFRRARLLFALLLINHHRAPFKLKFLLLDDGLMSRQYLNDFLSF